ncbi:hypothetical protein ACCO45_010583 [Purpureocillium lilacinum]|uniref:Uncharacterized protein n=1 Tax=Purpureocillium lilacinum TaxID=33203 RepID=A0ACC4DF76_PURLI
MQNLLRKGQAATSVYGIADESQQLDLCRASNFAAAPYEEPWTVNPEQSKAWQGWFDLLAPSPSVLLDHIRHSSAVPARPSGQAAARLSAQPVSPKHLTCARAAWPDTVSGLGWRLAASPSLRRTPRLRSGDAFPCALCPSPTSCPTASPSPPPASSIQRACLRDHGGPVARGLSPPGFSSIMTPEALRHPDAQRFSPKHHVVKWRGQMGSLVTLAGKLACLLPLHRIMPASDRLPPAQILLRQNSFWPQGLEATSSQPQWGAPAHPCPDRSLRRFIPPTGSVLRGNASAGTMRSFPNVATLIVESLVAAGL